MGPVLVEGIGWSGGWREVVFVLVLDDWGNYCLNAEIGFGSGQMENPDRSDRPGFGSSHRM